jgi:hypothetical protein
MTKNRIVLAEAGEMDPESGLFASQMGGAVSKATHIMRKLWQEKDTQAKIAAIRQELARLSNLNAEALQGDSACILSLPYSQIAEVDLALDSAVDIRCLTVKAQPQTHKFFFTQAGAFRAEQCLALIRRNVKAS